MIDKNIVYEGVPVRFVSMGIVIGALRTIGIGLGIAVFWSKNGTGYTSLHGCKIR